MPIAATSTPAGPPWLTITLGCVAVLASVLAAVMPAIVQRLKNREPPPDNTAQTDRMMDLFAASLEDLRRQRDDDELEVQRLRHLLDERETELRRRGWEG